MAISLASDPIVGSQLPLRRAAHLCFPGWNPAAFRLRLRFSMQARKQQVALAPFLSPKADTALADVMHQRPEVVGAVLWPYQCAGWEAEERLNRIAKHYQVIDSLGAPWRFPLGEKLELSDLSEYLPDLRFVIDQPQWFMREGGLVLNIFKGSFRAFSLAFSFCRTPDGRLQAVVGCLQGRNREGALNLYRDLTKALHGLRPRDMLFDVFRMICRTVGVSEVFGVTQTHRHHQHPYFGTKSLSPDYDAIWKDRDGTKLDDKFFVFDVAPPQRDLKTVKPNKRSLYRKRFVFLDALEAQIIRDLPGLSPIYFVDT